MFESWAKNNLLIVRELKKENALFIRMRYAAAFLHAILTLVLTLTGSLTSVQVAVLITITLCIPLYNLLFSRMLSPMLKQSDDSVVIDPESEGAQLTRIAFLQMIADTLVLSALMYMTGGVESPFQYLFVIHIVIGSMLLPLKLMATFAACVCLAFFTLSFLEAASVIPHFSFPFMYPVPVYSHLPFVMIHNLLFSIVLITTTFFAAGYSVKLRRVLNDLSNSMRELETSQKEKQQYTMAIVHELKRPMTAVYSYLSLILQQVLGPVPEKVAERLQKAMDRSDEAVKMVNEVLEVSRLKLMEQLKRRNIEISFLVYSVIGGFKENIEKRGTLVDVQDQLPIGFGLLADEFMIRLALSNVIGNAIKYSGEGGNVLITLEHKAGGKDSTLEVKVNDNGIGIPPDELQKLFTPFFRSSNAEGQGIEGTGFGLSLVKEIIEKHGGTLEVTSPSALGSEAKPGTCVTMILPVGTGN